MKQLVSGGLPVEEGADISSGKATGDTELANIEQIW